MRIVCCVTTDVNFDQRMRRICTTLTDAGHDVMLIGRRRKQSQAIVPQIFQQKRLPMVFQQGKLFYIEYNLRLFFALLFVKTDVICAIDLDSIIPCLWVSKLRNKKRVYDAHELFCEMDEIVARPLIYKVWKWIERYAVPQFKHGYTIGKCYANEFKKMYGVDYEIVRNATVLRETVEAPRKEKFILYQGAVNEGRCFEQLIPAMREVDATLVICGEGNYYNQAKALVKKYNLQHKIVFKGFVQPKDLIQYTQIAYIGITLFSSVGLSNYYSMANRFFDYMHANVPQICMKYPEYEQVNATYEIAFLVDKPTEENIILALNSLLKNASYHKRLSDNCNKAKKLYCWQQQEITLRKVYENL